MIKWEDIRAWYFRNGFTNAAANMREIIKQWDNDSRDLADYLDPQRALKLEPIYETRQRLKVVA